MREYLSALWNHWVYLMGGTIGVSLGIMLKFINNFWGNWLLIGGGIIGLFVAGYFTWKDKNKALKDKNKELIELKEKRKEELYEFLPEANKDRIYRKLSCLCEDGRFLRDSGTERRQGWDEDVLNFMDKYCSGSIKENYLRYTERRWGMEGFHPLSDDKYNNALIFVGDLFLHFNTHFTLNASKMH